MNVWQIMLMSKEKMSDEKWAVHGSLFLQSR